ncbi:MAG: FAD:protein FMN transferase [Succiniclasticum sp.]|jgi:FAD:protein FMN transferase
MTQEKTVSFGALGTVCRVTAAVEDALLYHVRDWVCALDGHASLFRPDSDISRLNRAAGQEAVPVTDDIAAVLEASKLCACWSQGAFSVTAGPLASLWRKALRTGTVPTDAALERAALLVNDEELVVEGRPGQRRAFLPRAGQSVDLGGIAKGYAADRAAAFLRTAGVAAFCIDFGGTLIVQGPPRTISIRHPQPGVAGVMADLDVQDTAVVTSGTYEQMRMAGASRLHHIIDCRTGRPAAAGLCSATLLGCSATYLDALATACIVLGPSASLNVLHRLPGPPAEAVFVTDSYDVLATPGLQGNLRLRPASSFAPSEPEPWKE